MRGSSRPSRALVQRIPHSISDMRSASQADRCVAALARIGPARIAATAATATNPTATGSPTHSPTIGNHHIAAAAAATASSDDTATPDGRRRPLSLTGMATSNANARTPPTNRAAGGTPIVGAHNTCRRASATDCAAHHPNNADSGTVAVYAHPGAARRQADTSGAKG